MSASFTVWTGVDLGRLECDLFVVEGLTECVAEREQRMEYKTSDCLTISRTLPTR